MYNCLIFYWIYVVNIISDFRFWGIHYDKDPYDIGYLPTLPIFHQYVIYIFDIANMIHMIFTNFPCQVLCLSTKNSAVLRFLLHPQHIIHHCWCQFLDWNLGTKLSNLKWMSMFGYQRTRLGCWIKFVCFKWQPSQFTKNQCQIWDGTVWFFFFFFFLSSHSRFYCSYKSL